MCEWMRGRTARSPRFYSMAGAAALSMFPSLDVLRAACEECATVDHVAGGGGSVLVEAAEKMCDEARDAEDSARYLEEFGLARGSSGMSREPEWLAPRVGAEGLNQRRRRSGERGSAVLSPLDPGRVQRSPVQPTPTAAAARSPARGRTRTRAPAGSATDASRSLREQHEGPQVPGGAVATAAVRVGVGERRPGDIEMPPVRGASPAPESPSFASPGRRVRQQQQHQRSRQYTAALDAMLAHGIDVGGGGGEEMEAVLYSFPEPPPGRGAPQPPARPPPPSKSWAAASSPPADSRHHTTFFAQEMHKGAAFESPRDSGGGGGSVDGGGASTASPHAMPPPKQQPVGMQHPHLPPQRPVYGTAWTADKSLTARPASASTTRAPRAPGPMHPHAPRPPARRVA